MRGTKLARRFALVFGLTYLAVGAAGFAVTGLEGFTANTDDAVLIFEVNPFHNVIHLGVGALWVAAAWAAPDEGTLGITVGIGIVYALATVLGFAGALEALSIDGPLTADNFLHAATAALALAFGRADRVLLGVQPAG